MDAKTKILDDLLPLLQPRGPELHEHAAILEVADVAQLVELASNPKIACFLLARLSEKAALIEPGAAGALAKALRTEGYTPKVDKGGAT